MMFKHMHTEHDIGSDSDEASDEADDNDDDAVMVVDSPSPPRCKPGPAVSV